MYIKVGCKGSTLHGHVSMMYILLNQEAYLGKFERGKGHNHVI